VDAITNVVLMAAEVGLRRRDVDAITNVVLMADPEPDITVSLMTTGKPFVAPGVLRWLSLLQRTGRRMPRDWGR